MNLDEFEETLQQFISNRYHPFAGAVATYVFDPQNTDEGFFSCRWLFTDNEQKPRSNVDYGKLYLGEDWYPKDSAVTILIEIMRGEKELGTYSILSGIESVLGRLYIPESVSYTGWPELFFEAKSPNRSASIPSDPIVKKGLQPYSSGTHAMLEWIWQGTISSSSGEARHANEMIILIPDTRARIANADWHGRSVKIIIEANINPDELEIQGIASLQSTKKTVNFTPVENEIDWELPGDANSVELFLVHSDGSLLGKINLRRPGDEFALTIGELSPVKQAEIDLRSGEDEHTFVIG